MLQQLFSSLCRDLAVDLGTAHTLIAAPGQGLVLDEPSVVAVDGRSGRLVSTAAVGQLARQMLGRTPDSISVVRPVRGGVICDFELCEAMLRYFFRKAQPAGVGRKPQILIAVPGSVTPVERRAVLNSAERAGARQVFLVGEALAAALGVGLPIAEPVASMICDIGGGTTDAAVLSLGEVIAGHAVRVGGDDMDAAIVDYLRRHYSLRVGTTAAEEVKLKLGSAMPLAEERVEEIRGLDAVSGLPRKATITSEEVREALSGPLDTILDCVRQVLDRLSPELAADLVDQGLVLCGGGALLRGLDRFLEEQTGLPVRVAPEPMTAVVRGALVCLERLDHWGPLLAASTDNV